MVYTCPSLRNKWEIKSFLSILIKSLIKSILLHKICLKLFGIANHYKGETHIEIELGREGEYGILDRIWMICKVSV